MEKLYNRPQNMRLSRGVEPVILTQFCTVSPLIPPHCRYNGLPSKENR